MSSEAAPIKFSFSSSAEDLVTLEAELECAGAQEIYAREAEHIDTETVDIVEGLVLHKGRISSESAAQLLSQNEVIDADLVPGKYEGGFKLWEGALDLARYLAKKYNISSTAAPSAFDNVSKLQGKKVLELGCGHGIPGILCLLAGADVHFQDYNAPVISSLTIPNVRSNVHHVFKGRPCPSTRYFSGDWLKVAPLLTSSGFGGYYDFVLTSESLYNARNQEKLLELMKQVVKPPHGVILVASKTYYFGVGGGTTAFRKLVKEDGIFEVECVHKETDAASGNVREVLSLTFPESIMPYFL